MKGTECDSADNADTEQLATAQQSGRGHMPVKTKADRLAANCLQKKRRRGEETTEEHAVRLQSLCSYQACRHLSETTGATVYQVSLTYTAFTLTRFGSVISSET